MPERIDGDPAELLGGSYELAEADVAAMSNEMITRKLREMLREAVRPGVHGWVDDDLAFVKAWGCDPRTITEPLAVRYAAADTLVPAAHGHWLAANIPRAIEELEPAVPWAPSTATKSPVSSAGSPAAERAGD